MNHVPKAKRHYFLLLLFSSNIIILSSFLSSTSSTSYPLLPPFSNLSSFSSIYHLLPLHPSISFPSSSPSPLLLFLFLLFLSVPFPCLSWDFFSASPAYGNPSEQLNALHPSRHFFVRRYTLVYSVSSLLIGYPPLLDLDHLS